MSTIDLRTIQAPLKERDRSDPGASQLTLRAQGGLGQGITCGVETGRALVEEVPVGFTDVRVRFELVSDASKERLDTLIRLTERYCVVLQTLRRSPAVAASYAVVAEPAA